MAITEFLARSGEVATPREEVAMKKIMMFSLLRFAVFAAPITIMYFVH